MIEFKIPSLNNSSKNGDFWQGLNAASVAVQQAAQSETAVYQVFSERLTKLGLHGTISMLNESGTKLRIKVAVFSERQMKFIRQAEKIANLSPGNFEYPADASKADFIVLTKGNIVFLPDNSEKIEQVFPPHIFRFIKVILKSFLKMPAILAPIFAKSNIIGVLYLAGSNLRVEDVPAIAAYATHLSIAMENARLFQAVQQAESQYRRLFESANDGIFVFDQNSRQLLSANPKMLKLLGKKEIEEKELWSSEWASSNVYKLYNKHISLTLQKGSHFFEMPFIDQTGNNCHWQVSATVIELDGKTVIHGLVRDITTRVQANLVQSVIYHIATVAHTNNSLDELYVFIHEALAPILNVQNFYIVLYNEVSDMVDVVYFVDEYDPQPGAFKAGKGLTEFVLDSNTPQLLTHSMLMDYYEEGIVNIQGTLPQVWLGVPLQSQGKAIGALVVQSYEESSAYSEQDAQVLTFVSEQIANAIERKKAEERQRQLTTELTQQTRLREAIMATTPDNFLLCDRNGRFQFISTQILGYLGIPVDSVVGKTWQELGIPASFGRLFDQDRERVFQTRSSVTSEYQYALSDATREIEIITNPILDEKKGDITMFVATARDVTEKKKAARAMNRAQKMESLGILAGGIAHDFNNLLVVMMSQTSLAQAHLDSNHPAYVHVGKAGHAAEKAASLTQQLLAYSGGGKFSVMPANLNDLIQENIDLLKMAMPKQIALDLILKDDLPLIDADLTQIQQIVMNLLINAAEAIGEQTGTIQIQTAVRQTTSEDHAFWRYTGDELPPGAYVSLRIQDSGSGVQNETVSKIFDPFFTKKFTGRGLGLAAVLGIVRSHRGGLHVSSEIGKGTIFELLFPVSENTAVANKPVPKNEDFSVNGLVLVIDDEASVREAVGDILELEGIDVLGAANGSEGIAIYKEKADNIDLVILDLSMPGLSGQDTFIALQKMDADVRILLSSGYSEMNATRGLESPPLVGFVQKPYQLDAFIDKVQKCLQKKG
ncbi:MAG: PAS domain S-box protein [Chloroflexi bacterium]|nr:PAS domain S-box protein [Chloroflexota bacterium]